MSWLAGRLQKIERHFSPIIHCTSIAKMNNETINCFLCGGSHTLDVCPEPAIKITWEEILGEVNQEDREDEDFDEVRMFLENTVHDLMIIAVSVRFCGGIPTEGRHRHISRILGAVRNHMRELREHVLQIEPGKCLVQFIEEDEVERVMECPICYDEIEHPRTAMLGCRHEFCRPCLEQHIEKNKMTCPMCRGEIQQITIRRQEDYVAICELAARTSAPVDAVDDDDDYIRTNLYIIPPNYPIHHNDIIYDIHNLENN